MQPSSPPAPSSARKPRPPARQPEQRLLIRLMQLACVFYARIYHRVIVRVPARLPRTGPAILVSNHTSGLDPLLIQSVLQRLVTWMMAREYYLIRPITPILKAIDVIPVDRSGRDMAATRAALRTLADGRVLGIFPEGKIEPTRDLLPFQSGVAMMAIKSKVPVYPVYLDGTQRGKEMGAAFLGRHDAVLAFGPEVQFDRSATSREALEAATRRIEEAVRALKERMERGVGQAGSMGFVDRNSKSEARNPKQIQNPKHQ